MSNLFLGYKILYINFYYQILSPRTRCYFLHVENCPQERDVQDYLIFDRLNISPGFNFSFLHKQCIIRVTDLTAGRMHDKQILIR